MALILQIETATTVCSVAIAENGRVLALKEQNERNIHASSITLFIEEVMKLSGKSYHDLDAIAISKGPGSYTGLRIGVSTAKGMCFALDIPLIAIDTLKAMASGLSSGHELADNTLLCPMIDARRMEVYTALFNTSLEMTEPVNARILDQNSYDEYLESLQVIFFGDGAEKSKPFFEEKENAKYISFENSAAHLSGLAYEKFLAASFEDVAYFEPFYLKDFISTNPPKN